MTGHEVAIAGGPYFDELEVGQVFDGAPSVTLTPGMAAVHQVIVGDRMRLALDGVLTALVTGANAPVAHPALVWDMAIGQSTLVTQRVKANLFYRGLAFHRFPVIGDTLSTRTEIVGLKQNSNRSGRAPTGLAALRVTTSDQDGQRVLDFYRCAMLPMSPGVFETGYRDDLSEIGSDVVRTDPAKTWDAHAFRAYVGGPHFTPELAGTVLRSSGDVVSSAPELARLTLNIASTHHDSGATGQRLVYGGHTIGLALAQTTRLLPNLAAILSWKSCDHLSPVHEGDTLYSVLRVDSATLLPEHGGGEVDLRSSVYAAGSCGAEDRQVLDWHFTALMF